MTDTSDYWHDVKSAKEEWQASPQGRRFQAMKEQQFKKAKAMAKAFAQDHNNLTFKCLNLTDHFRVKNEQTGQYIDFWRSHLLRHIDGSFTGIGRNARYLQEELNKLL